MYKTYYLFIITIILCSSCNTSYFTTVNNMRNIMGRVYTNDNDIKEGSISVNNEGGLMGGREYIRFTPKNGAVEKIAFKDFKEISIRGEFYTPKILDNGWIGGSNRMYLVKRLTKPSSKIQFYEHLEVRNNTNTDAAGNVWNNDSKRLQYYISLPNMDKYATYNIERKNIVPNFEDKVSLMVSDCNSLAEKIKQKEKGYFYAQLSFNNDKKIATWMRIIDEYNECQ